VPIETATASGSALASPLCIHHKERAVHIEVEGRILSQASVLRVNAHLHRSLSKQQDLLRCDMSGQRDLAVRSSKPPPANPPLNLPSTLLLLPDKQNDLIGGGMATNLRPGADFLENRLRRARALPT
jgi:hypothetical protein